MVEGEGWPPCSNLARSALDSNETGVEPGGRTMDWDWLTGVGGGTGAGRTAGVGVAVSLLMLPALALVRSDEVEGEEVGGLLDFSLSPRAMVPRIWACPRAGCVCLWWDGWGCVGAGRA